MITQPISSGFQSGPREIRVLLLDTQCEASDPFGEGGDEEGR